MMQKKIKWGVLGCARIARDRFIPGLLQSKNAELYAIAGRSMEKLTKFNKMFHPVKIYHSYDELLNDPNIDAVYIPLPNHLHCEWVKKATAKKKHVLCEKPLALNPDEILEMKLSAEKNNVLLAEAFAYLHGDCMKIAKEIINENTIGQLRHIDVRYQIVVDSMGVGKENDIRYQPEYGGGVTYDLGCYAISFMRNIYEEEPSDIKVFTRKAASGIDEHVSMNLEFPSGRTAHAFVSFDTFYEQNRTLVGEKGTLIFPTPFNYAGDSQYILSNTNGINQVISFHCRDHYQTEAEEFSSCILNGTKPLVDINYSLENAKVIDRILKLI